MLKKEFMTGSQYIYYRNMIMARFLLATTPMIKGYGCTAEVMDVIGNQIDGDYHGDFLDDVRESKAWKKIIEALEEDKKNVPGSNVLQKAVNDVMIKIQHGAEKQKAIREVGTMFQADVSFLGEVRREVEAQLK